MYVESLNDEMLLNALKLPSIDFVKENVTLKEIEFEQFGDTFIEFFDISNGYQYPLGRFEIIE